MSTPGPNWPDLHLCQPDRQKSCAWCCGMYNVRHKGRAALSEKLRERTRRFAGTARSVEAILRFSEHTMGQEQARLVDPEFYSCEFIGFLDSSENRVGCMLHPLALGNHGVDWRGISFHGAMACQGFFCRSFRELDRTAKRLVIAVIQDWHLYGLVISDTDYLRSFFRLLEEGLERKLKPAELLASSVVELVLEFFRWKTDWPFKRSEMDSACSESRPPPQGEDDAGWSGPSGDCALPFELVFRSLGSHFRSEAERRSGEHMVEELISLIIRTL